MSDIECKYKKTDRTGLYIMVFLIMLATVFNTAIFFDKNDLPASKKDIQAISLKIDSLKIEIEKLNDIIK